LEPGFFPKKRFRKVAFFVLYIADKIGRVRDIILKANSVVVLTGAGISAESGIATYRGKDGIWQKFAISELANPEAFAKNPRKVWEWYGQRRREMIEATPNSGHEALARLERIVEDFTMITQNIDNMHRRAGNQNIIEIHGNVFENRCMKCGHIEKNEKCNFPKNEPLPVCSQCGSPARVNVVWFGEEISPEPLEESFVAAEKSDVFISAGTSAKVYPAAYFPELAKKTGAILIEINMEITHLSSSADFLFQGKTGEILPKLVGEV